MIAVFISNKLVSTDTILPLVMELHRLGKSGVVRFYTPDRRTYDAICQNIVLCDAINSIGALFFIGVKSKTWFHRWMARLAFLPLIINLWFHSISRNLTVIHFGYLDTWPFRIVFHVASPLTIRFESKPNGFTVLETEVTDIVRSRVLPDVVPAANLCVGFRASEFPEIEIDTNAVPPRILHHPVMLTRAWRDFIQDRADTYFRKEFESAEVPESQEIMTVVLGYYGQLDYLIDGVQLELLHLTIDAMLEVGGERPIFLKPHIVTDLSLVANVLKRYEGAPILVSYLHPSVLATRSRMMVSNYYSTVLGVVKMMGVPTIEFTGYTDGAMKLTGNESMRPEDVDYFVNLDVDRFKACLEMVLSAPKETGISGPIVHELDPILISLMQRKLSVSNLKNARQSF